MRLTQGNLLNIINGKREMYFAQRGLIDSKLNFRHKRQQKNLTNKKKKSNSNFKYKS